MAFQLVFWGRCEFCQEIILHEEFTPSSCEQVTGEKCDGEIAELYWRMEVEEEEMAARYEELAREWYSKGWM